MEYDLAAPDAAEATLERSWTILEFLNALKGCTLTKTCEVAGYSDQNVLYGRAARNLSFCECFMSMFIIFHFHVITILIDNHLECLQI